MSEKEKLIKALKEFINAIIHKRERQRFLETAEQKDELSKAISLLYEAEEELKKYL